MAGGRLAVVETKGRSDILVLGGSRLVAAVLGSMALVILAGRVEPSVLGVWAMALGIQGYALHVGEFGLRSMVTAIGRATCGGPRALIAPYLGLRLSITTAVVAGSLLVVAQLAPAQLPLMAVTLLSLYPITLQLDWVCLVEGRWSRAALPLVVRPLVFMAAVAVWPEPIEPLDVALAFVAAWAAASTSSLLLLGQSMPLHGMAAIPRPAALLRRGGGYFAVTAANQLQLSADTLVVGLFLGADKAGVYFLAVGITTAATVFANAAGQLTLARAQRAVRADADRSLLEALGLGTILAAGLAVAGPLLLPLAFGSDFAAAGYLLVWLAPYLALAHGTAVLQPRLGATGHQGAVIRTSLVLSPVLGIGLVAAALSGEPAGFAAVRSLVEAVRLALLWRAARNLSAGTASTFESQATPPLRAMANTG